MAAGKEIKEKISSIKNTQKITSAMEKVAVSKMKRAQARMQKSRHYDERIRSVVGHIAQAHSEYPHRYLHERKIKKVGYIVVSSDRGLCGGLNSNLFRQLLKDAQTWTQKEVSVSFCALGAKATQFFKHQGGDLIAAKTQLGDVPELAELIGVVKAMLEQFDKQKIDRLYLVSNRFVNTMVQKPTTIQLLPLKSENSEGIDNDSIDNHWDYIYEPDARDILDGLLWRYIESQVYQSVIENGACEQAARMLAMKSASDNASGLIDDLNLLYNKARQAAITQEISEIVGGAAAV